MLSSVRVQHFYLPAGYAADRGQGTGVYELNTILSEYRVLSCTMADIASEELDSLAAAAQRGDRSAYDSLLSCIISICRSYCSGRIYDSALIEDTVQEVLISVHTSLAAYNPEKPFRPWLMAIIARRSYDMLRKIMRNRGMLIYDEELISAMPAPEFRLHHDFSDELNRALALLPNKMAEIIRLLKRDRYSMREIAEKMNMSVSAVKVSAHRGYAKLREILTESS